MIRAIQSKDLPKLFELAKMFNNSTKFLNCNPEIFQRNWASYITAGVGVIWVLGDFQGALGAIKFEDPNAGELTAIEMFWFVDPSCRGKGLLLYKAFEQWAKDQGCKKMVMAHLSDSMPEQLKKFYHRQGFEEMETHYIKRC